MIVKEYFYNVKCECCNALVDEALWDVDEDGAKEKVYDSDWKVLGGKHYCPKCWHYDENDNIVTADGNVWDEDTESQDYMELENEFLMDEEGTCITRIYRGEQVEDGFLTGAKHGCKEAIALAKEWLEENYHLFDHFDKDEVIADFEADMNKLLEEEK